MENTDPTARSSTASADADETVMADIDALTRQLDEYETRLAEMREVMLRERAELDNQRKRLQRDLEQARRFANEKLLADLLARARQSRARSCGRGRRLRGSSQRRRADASASSRASSTRTASRSSIRSASRSIPSATRR